MPEDKIPEPFGSAGSVGVVQRSKPVDRTQSPAQESQGASTQGAYPDAQSGIACGSCGQQGEGGRNPGDDTNIENILAERGKTHGDFSITAELAQELKLSIRAVLSENSECTDEMREAIDMICTKLARIASGDPYHIDSWQDIAGYAMLVVKDLHDLDND
jgi:hypothetical protein